MRRVQRSRSTSPGAILVSNRAPLPGGISQSLREQFSGTGREEGMTHRSAVNTNSALSIALLSIPSG